MASSATGATEAFARIDSRARSSPRGRATTRASSRATGSRRSRGCRATWSSGTNTAIAIRSPTRSSWSSRFRSRARRSTRWRRSSARRNSGTRNTLSICNVRESAIPRASRFVFYTRAGAEIGVASTKAFTTQLASLFTLTLAIAKAKGRLLGGARGRRDRAAALRAGQHPARAQPRAADPGVGRALRRRGSTRSSSAAASTTRWRSRARSS